MATTMGINKREFKARRFHFVWNMCILLLFPVMLVKIMEHGLFPLSRTLNFLIGGLGWLWLGMLLISFFVPFRNLVIIVTEKTLEAPVLGNLFSSKSITVALSEIVVSTNLRDKLHGFEVSTHDGEGILVSSLLYGRKNKQRLIREIELRKARLACEKKEVAG